MNTLKKSAAYSLNEFIPDVDFHKPFRDLIAPSSSTEPKLAKAILHVLDHPGSFIRCRMAWKVGYLCGLREESCTNIAIAIEYFHTASLIFDDLSSMDDADTRRGSRCVHVLYGEATAMLSALAFVNKAYNLLWGETTRIAPSKSQAANNFVYKCLGTNGILDGQSRDLTFSPEDNSPEKILQISKGKTVTLLSLALCLPAIIAGAPEVTIALLKKLSIARGLGYQIADDFKDVLLSEEESGKTTDRDQSMFRPNMVISEGMPTAAKRLASYIVEGDAIQDTLLQREPRWKFLSQLRITVGPKLISQNGTISKKECNS